MKYKKGDRVKVWSLQSFNNGGFLEGVDAIVHQDQIGDSVLIEVERNIEGKTKLDPSYEVYPQQLERIIDANDPVKAEPPMKYKIGDKVLIKEFDELKTTIIHDYLTKPDFLNVAGRVAGQELVIREVIGHGYIFEEPYDAQNLMISFEEECIERLVEPNKYTADILLKEYNPESVSIGLIAELKSEKPPIGIAPRKLYEEMANTARINDLWDVMDRYIKDGCKILPEWIEELKERYKMVEEN